MSKLTKNGKVDYKRYQSVWINKEVVKDLKRLKMNLDAPILSDVVKGLVAFYKKRHPERF